MSLKNKTYSEYHDSRVKFIYLTDYEDAVALYKDAINNPEKHLELLKEYIQLPELEGWNPNDWKNYLKYHIPLKDSTKWHNFLFKKVFE